MMMFLLLLLLLLICTGLLSFRSIAAEHFLGDWRGSVISKFGKIGTPGAHSAGQWILAARLFVSGPHESLKGTLEIYDKVRQTFAFEISNGKNAVSHARLFSYGDMHSSDRPFRSAVLKPMLGDAAHNEFRLYLQIHRASCSGIPVGWFTVGDPAQMVLARSNGKTVKVGDVTKAISPKQLTLNEYQQIAGMQNALVDFQEDSAKLTPTPWRCRTSPKGETLILRKNQSGDVQCMSSNGSDCIQNPSDCQLLTAQPSYATLTCGQDHLSKTGMLGYSTKNHWCSWGRDNIDSLSKNASNSRPVSGQLFCNHKSTVLRPAQHGKPYVLTQHPLQCSGSADFDTGVLSDFSMKLNPSGDLYQYTYSCCSGKGTGINCKPHKTSSSSTASNSGALNKHDLKCGKDEALSSVRLVADNDNTQYEYTCCSAPGMNTCRQLSTPLSDDDEGDARALAQHNVRCKSGEVLRSVRLVHDPATGKQQYIYSCCK